MARAPFEVCGMPDWLRILVADRFRARVGGYGKISRRLIRGRGEVVEDQVQVGW
jgi:hypothetical protein